MRKTCAQAVLVMGTLLGILAVLVTWQRVIPFLFTRLLAGSSQLLGSFTQSSGAILSGVQVFLSTVSTRITTITTFYLNNSLIIHRGIN